MIELQTVRRVTVYTTTALEPGLLEHFASLGARGYTVTPCRGKGSHDAVADPFGGDCHSRIEILVPDDVADKILMYLEADHLKNQPITAVSEQVKVSKRWHSARTG